MWSKKFWLEALERAVKTFAQTLVGLIIGDAAIDHVYATITAKLGMAGMAAGVSLLTSIAGTQVGANNSPAWLPESEDPPAPRKRGDAGAVGIEGIFVILIVLALAVWLGLAVHPLFFLLIFLLLFFALV